MYDFCEPKALDPRSLFKGGQIDKSDKFSRVGGWGEKRGRERQKKNRGLGGDLLTA